MSHPEFTPPSYPGQSGYPPAATPSWAPQPQPRTPSRGPLYAVAVAGWLAAGLVVALGSPIGLVWTSGAAAPGQSTPPTSGGTQPGGAQTGAPRSGPTPTVGIGRKSAVGAVLPDTLHGYARAHSADPTIFDIQRPDVAFYDVPGHADSRLGLGVTLTSQDVRKMWDADKAYPAKRAFGDVLCSQGGLAIVCTTQLLHGTLTATAFAGNVPDMATLAVITSEAYAALP